MAIRDANFSDIPQMLELILYGYGRSHYAKDCRVKVDEKYTKGLLVKGIQRHGHKTGGGCFAQVAENECGVTGLVVGTLNRVYGIGDKLMASDLFWVSRTGVADPTDAPRLMRNMVEWARSNPEVIEIICAVTSVVEDDPRRPGLILERLGMKHYGGIWRMEL